MGTLPLVDLYALPPEEFTAARDAAAREARRSGDRPRAVELAALRRPTAPAHAVNALVRAEPALVDQLLELGAQLASAQAAGEGEALRALGAQRRQVVEAVVDRAQAAAGRRLAPAARAEVTATLEAALADPGSAEAVRSGRLVRALSYAGFGGVDLDGAVAAAGGSVPAPSRGRPGRRAPVPSGGERQRAAAEQRTEREGQRAAAEQAEQARAAAQRRAEAERAARDAAGALDDAVRAAEQAEQARAAAQRAADEAAGQVLAAEQALARSREERDDAQAQARRMTRDLERAHAVVREAQTAVEQARARLDRA